MTSVRFKFPIKAIWILFCVLPRWVTPALAGCELTLNAPHVQIHWNQNFSIQAVTFSVTKTSHPACDISVTFTTGGSGDYSQRQLSHQHHVLNYQLYRDSSLTQVLMDESSLGTSHYFSAHFSKGNDQTQSFTYYVQIPQAVATVPTYKPSGHYTDTFSIKVFDHPVPGVESPRATSHVTISARIPKILEISLTHPGGIFNPHQTTRNIDFGILSPGSSQSFALMVRTNAGYMISLSSQNNGRLRYTLPSVVSTVPYQLFLDSSLKDLSSSSTTPVSVVTGSAPSLGSGVSHLVNIVIGSTEQSLAGSYSDSITVTAVTTE